MENIFGRLAKKITKKVEKEERGKDPLIAYRITGLNKLSEIKPEVMAELIRRARG